jgi:ribosomal protein S13
MGDKSSISPLNTLLTDSNIQVRINAAIALSNLADIGLGDLSSVQLLNKLIQEPDVKVRETALNALGRLAEINLGDVTSIPLLNEQLTDSETEIRSNAVFALGSLAYNVGIGESSSIPLLNQLLNDTDVNIRANAANALEDLAEIVGIGDQSSLPLLNMLMNDSDADIRENAERALKQINLLLQIKKEPKMETIPKKTSLDVDKYLEQVVVLYVPEYMETGTSAEIVVNVKNDSDETLEHITVNFSDLENFFLVEGEVSIPILRPGMVIKKRIKIKPRFDEGIFPVKLKIISGRTQVVQNYTIKVGGTDIY